MHEASAARAVEAFFVRRSLVARFGAEVVERRVVVVRGVEMRNAAMCERPERDG